MVFGTVTGRTNAPEPGRVSLRIVWGVATFAIIGVLGLAQLAPVRDAFLAQTAWVGPFVGQLAGPSVTPGADRQLDAAAPSAGADPAVAPATDEAWPNGSRAIAASGRTAAAAPVDGSPETAPSVISASADAMAVQPTAEPNSATMLTVLPTAAVAPIDEVAPALVVSVVLDPLTTAVAVPLASVTAAVTAAVTTAVATAVTTVTSVTTVIGSVTPPTPTPIVKITLPGGGTITTVR